MISKKLGDFFLFCSGASQDVLQKCPSTERTRYISIGVTVFCTGLFAAFSCFYALYRVFLNESYAISASLAVSIVWGLFVFNLDRFLVSTVKKEGVFYKDFINVSPRIILAIVIAVVIATPLKVKIFEDRLVQQVFDMQKVQLAENSLAFTNQYKVSSLKQEQDSIEEELARVLEKSVGEPEGELYKYQIELHGKCQEEKKALESEANKKIPAERIVAENQQNKINELVASRKEVRAQKEATNSDLLNVQSRIRTYLRIEEVRLKAKAQNEGSVLQRVPVISSALKDEKRILEDRINELQSSERSLTQTISDLVAARDNTKLRIKRLLEAPGAKQDECDSIYKAISDLRDETNRLNAEQAEERKARRDEQKIKVAEAEAKAQEMIDQGEEVIAVSFSLNFLTQLEALGGLLEERFSMMWWTHWMLSLLFILIETAPIIVKLLMPMSPYDTIADQTDRESAITGREFATNHRKEKIAMLLKERIERTSQANEKLFDEYQKSIVRFTELMTVNLDKFNAAAERLAQKENSKNLLAELYEHFTATSKEALRGFRESNKALFEVEELRPE